MKIAVDAMGGDRAPRDVVEGVVQAVLEYGTEAILVGDEPRIRAELDRICNGGKLDLISIQHASQMIGMGESPIVACRSKPDASVVVAARMVSEERAAAMVSVGNTGACMTAALLGLGRMRGVQRPAIGVPIPHPRGVTILLDAGANVDCRPLHLAQFAVMGEVYAEQIWGIKRPRVGLLNVGEEEGKGGETMQEAHLMLRDSGLNFIGNVEGRDIVNGRADVVVCDGFVGNIVLKFAEGMIEALFEFVKNGYAKGGPLVKLGAMLSKPVFSYMKETLDPAGFGGAPLLGLKGTCIVGHGSSSPRAVKNAIGTAMRFISHRTNSQIGERLRALGLSRVGHR